jgi:hypothetical protein
VFDFAQTPETMTLRQYRGEEKRPRMAAEHSPAPGSRIAALAGVGYCGFANCADRNEDEDTGDLSLRSYIGC